MLLLNAFKIFKKLISAIPFIQNIETSLHIPNIVTQPQKNTFFYDSINTPHIAVIVPYKYDAAELCVHE